MVVKKRTISDKLRGIKIGVLMGGPSSEREISLKSGKAVYEALNEYGLKVIPIDIKTDDIGMNIQLINSYRLDCVFLALHGRFGEDGQIQEILDVLRIPYTGSGAMASRLAMDKIASRQIFGFHGLNVPRSRILYKPAYKTHKKFVNNLGWPRVVKPTQHGSSIGLSIVREKGKLKKAIDMAFDFDERVIIEEYIAGRELTVGILAEKPLPVIEIIPKNYFFDYDAKYHAGMTEYVVPANISENIAYKVKEAALASHKLLGCFGCSRVDIILDKRKTPFVLEINTIPGLTATSLLPKAAKCVGKNFTALCLELIGLAYEKK